jgi:hypothetical protein
MHAQTESAPEHRARAASSLHVASGLGLYLLTLAGEAMLGAGARWLLTYLGASALGLLFPLGPSAEQLAWFAALAPLLWSIAGLLLPGRAWIWRRRLGARAPSADEAVALDDALELLRSVDPSLPGPSGCYVLDEPLPEAYVRGRALILSRGLVDSDALAAALAHELSHANSLDGGRRHPGPATAQPALGHPLARPRVRRRRLRRLPRPGRGPRPPPLRAGAPLRRPPAPPALQHRPAPAGGAPARALAGELRGDGVGMSAAPVLGAMTKRRCTHTGLSIPECCCRHCCEAQLRRYAPELLRRFRATQVVDSPHRTAEEAMR